MMEVQDGAELCFPQLLNASCRKPMLSWSEAVILRTVMSFFSLLTVALNLLVIISVSHFRQLHTPTNLFLLSLAVSDFLVGLMIPGLMMLQTSCWFLGDIMCLLSNCLSFIVTEVSVLDMVFISIDRYVAICDPLHYTSRITVKRVQVCVCLCWIYSAFYVFFCERKGLAHPERYKTCYGECVIVIDDISGAVALVCSFIIPVSIIVILYMRVFVVAVAQARAMRSHVATLQVSLMSKKSELKAARTLGVIVVVFLICFCPYYAVSLVGYSSNNTSPIFIVVYLFFLNSCLNPVIYAMFYPWFRKAIKLIVSLQILQSGSCEAKLL